ncbi:MAG TPA: DUF2795 domain-containing protein [Acidimicrobiales bacterium]
MGRTTDKHTPRRDDQMKHEEAAMLQGSPDEGRTEPRRAEEPGPGEGGLGVRPEAEEPYHGAPTESEIQGRAALAATFPPAMFPARRQQLIDEAEAGHADDALLRLLRRIPERTYDTVGEVWDEITVAGGAPG